MKWTIKLLAIQALVLTLTGCFSTDKPMLGIGSSDYFPELEGIYTSLEPEQAAEMGYVEEDAAFISVSYSHKGHIYSCAAGQLFFTLDVLKLAEDIYLFQSSIGDEKGELAFFRRMQDGRLIKVQPKADDLRRMLKQLAIGYDSKAEGLYNLQSVRPAEFAAFVQKLIRMKLIDQDSVYHKFS